MIDAFFFYNSTGKQKLNKDFMFQVLIKIIKAIQNVLFSEKTLNLHY